jgi:group II intron reverse transcriptase/maturase
MALKRDAAAGVDGVTWRDYEADLENSLRSLHERIHRGTYRAQPVRRCFILKADGKQRPLGITTLEDKIAQRAVASILNAIYEEDFLGFSYGFRPGRNQHDALDALATGIQAERVNWILDSDIRSYFDRINKSWLIRFLEHRIGDKRIIRLLRKWLKAGVLEEGIWSISETGVSQGATISPLLSNIFLHYVFDLWAVQWRRREASGKMIVLRFADDCVAGFEREADAKRFRDAMRARLEQFALELHTDKTRLLEFGRFAASNRKRRGMGKPETFTFLGFIFICGKSRRGAFQLQRKSCGDRMRATLQEIKAKLRRCMHVPIPVQGKWLRSVVQGYYAYHAVPTNSRAIGAFRYHVMGIWRRVLQRRSQKSNITWERMTKIAAAWLPLPKILHPWPDLRFYVKHPRWEPSARIALAGICAGGA